MVKGEGTSMKSGFCEICHEWTDDLQDHHPHKQAVFGRGKNNKWKVPVCPFCHHNIEFIITQKENEILRRYKHDLYEYVFNQFFYGKIDIEKVNRERLASKGKGRK